MALSPQWLDELRARVTLSSVIMRTAKLQKAGREWKACCPFHSEKTPSFTVSDEKGFYHCLAGETRVITDRGLVAIAELAGRTAKVLSRNRKWIEADFHEYGRQQLWRIDLSRNRQRKTIYATAGHRWFAKNCRNAITTDRLRPGHCLEAAFPEKCDDWTLDPVGIRHGIVFGDGTMFKRVYGTLNLHGRKDAELARWFPDQEPVSRCREDGKPYLKIYGGRAFDGMKELPPLDASRSYLLGFLAGYLAADGHVSKDATVMLNSANADHLDAVREIAARAGIATFGRTTQIRKGLHGRMAELHRIHFVNSTLDPGLFLLSEAKRRFLTSSKKYERLRWQVRSAVPAGRVEKVFCAQVPDEHAFALEDNILTGNCFGCGAHGDAIRWMTDQRGMSFIDAVKELAAEAGMEVPAPDPRSAERAERQHVLHDVMASAQEWFKSNLLGPEGERARAYLKARGLDAHTIDRFGFGYAPDNRKMIAQALKNFDEKLLIEAGMLIQVEDKDPYDRFRGRLMLPIEDARGRVIAFGGRILDSVKTDVAKYLNSPDTPLFDKGRTLYNLHRAGPISRQSGRIVVVEGYMDVIALSAAGIGEAVAPMGTALTERQLELLWRLAEVPVLCFDGDAAGQRAAMRAATRALPMLRPGHSLSIVRLPAGMDPDDVVKQRGRDAMEQLLAEPRSLLDTLWEHEAAAHPLETPEDKAGLKARLMEHCEAIQHPDIRGLYRRELLDRFSAFAYPPRAARDGNWRGPQKPVFPALSSAASGRLRKASGGGLRDGLAQAVLAGLARYPSEIHRHAEALGRLAPSDPALARDVDALLDAAEALEMGGKSPISGAESFAAPPDNARFSFLMEGADPQVAREDLAEAVALLVERPALEVALADATARFEQTFEDAAFEEQQRLLKRKLEFERRLGQMASKRAAAPAQDTAPSAAVDAADAHELD